VYACEIPYIHAYAYVYTHMLISMPLTQDMKKIASSHTDVGGRADMLPLQNFTASKDDANCCFDVPIEAGEYVIQYKTGMRM
jgi:hypothetical protein